jgi:hypothetical protein
MQRRLPIEPCAVAARNGSSFARSVGIGMWDGRGMAETEDGFVLVWTHAAGLAVPCVTGTCAAPRPVAGPLFSNTRGRGDSVPVAARRDVNLTGRCSADRGTGLVRLKSRRALASRRGPFWSRPPAGKSDTSMQYVWSCKAAVADVPVMIASL